MYCKSIHHENALQRIFVIKIPTQLAGFNRIYQLHLCRVVRFPNYNECPRFDTKQSDDEAPVVQPWVMWSSPSLPLLSGPP